MSYQFKLSRRVARLRAPALAALAVAMSACNASDTTGSDGSPTDANPTPSAIRATAGSTISAMTTATGSCLTQSGPLVTLAGDQSVYNDRKSTQSNRRVDARSAWWSGVGNSRCTPAAPPRRPFAGLEGSSKGLGLRARRG